jgi:hypothetical protein
VVQDADVQSSGWGSYIAKKRKKSRIMGPALPFYWFGDTTHPFDFGFWSNPDVRKA